MRSPRDTEDARGRSDRLAHTLRCAECGTLSAAEAWGWRGYRMDVLDEYALPELAFYCPECSAREFGGP